MKQNQKPEKSNKGKAIEKMLEIYTITNGNKPFIFQIKGGLERKLYGKCLKDIPFTSILGWIRLGYIYHYKPIKRKKS